MKELKKALAQYNENAAAKINMASLAQKSKNNGGISFVEQYNAIKQPIIETALMKIVNLINTETPEFEAWILEPEDYGKSVQIAQGLNNISGLGIIMGQGIEPLYLSIGTDIKNSKVVLNIFFQHLSVIHNIAYEVMEISIEKIEKEFVSVFKYVTSYQ